MINNSAEFPNMIGTIYNDGGIAYDTEYEVQVIVGLMQKTKVRYLLVQL